MTSAGLSLRKLIALVRMRGGEGDNSVSCFLQGALELDASFKNAGRPNGLEDAKQLIESLSSLRENACAALRDDEMMPMVLYGVGRGTPGRWTMSCQ